MSDSFRECSCYFGVVLCFLGRLVFLCSSARFCVYRYSTKSRPLKHIRHPEVQQAVAMAQKTLWVTSPNGDRRMLTVMETTTVKEILQQCYEGCVQDRQSKLIRGVAVLEPGD